uniref:Uncharacterized protein n=1 Tax=Rhizophora mucronata TaxID=61149 RepID=A0A2P2KMZ5_RHIMU
MTTDHVPSDKGNLYSQANDMLSV